MIVLTVHRSYGEYIAHNGREMEEGRPYGVGKTPRQALDNLHTLNERDTKCVHCGERMTDPPAAWCPGQDKFGSSCVAATGEGKP